MLCYLLMQTVSEEKEKTAAELEERERIAKQLEEEKKRLEEKTTHLEGDLLVIKLNLPLSSLNIWKRNQPFNESLVPFSSLSRGCL